MLYMLCEDDFIMGGKLAWSENKSLSITEDSPLFSILILTLDSVYH